VIVNLTFNGTVLIHIDRTSIVLVVMTFLEKKSQYYERSHIVTILKGVANNDSSVC